ncbi:MAG: SurA N-terminal domain-containing protein [Burkholderiales bacterium]|nr:SurA N-terminal domain-containing protein [Burkholderiales bacterium]
MFEYIRTHQRLMQFLLLLIIFPSFAFFGIESYTRSRGSESAVATVAGHPISQQEFDAAMRDQLERLRQMYGPQFDSKMLNTAEARQEILDELVARKAIAAEIANRHLVVTDSALQKNIMSTPELMKPDGSFDLDRYKNLLASQGMTPAMYEQRLREDMAFQQLLGAVQHTAFVPKAVIERLALINEQEREVQMLQFKPSDYVSQVKVTDDMLKAYYEKNVAQFEVPEQIKAEYVVLNSEALAGQITVSDAEVQSFYDQNKKSYGTDEQRKASHILINASKNASDAEKAKAKAKAESLLAELRKNPSAFAKLAKENSQDSGSAAQGGDLGYFGKGTMVKPFEDMAFKLKENEISDIVQSDFGFHIIQLTGIKPATIKPLDEVKSQIIDEIKKQKAGKAYSEAAETFSNTVYEQADSLKPVADKLKLKIETVDGLTRLGNAALAATAATNNPKFLKAIFSDEALKKKHNTEAIEVAPNTLIAGHVVEYKAAFKRPFDEVKATIVAKVTESEAESLAEKEGKAKLASLQQADSVTGFGDVKIVSRIKNQEIPGNAFLEVMKANVQKLPAFVGVNLNKSGYAIYRIGKVTAGKVDPARRKTEAQQIANFMSEQEALSYVEMLKKKAKATISPSAIAVPVNGN